MNESDCIVHPFEPVFDQQSSILILGSFPSVKSRENRFYYGHPRNRFWKVMAALFKEDEPETIEEKKNFLLNHHIALWDVLLSCEIRGSADATIKNAEPAPLEKILDHSDVTRIFCNGKAAEKYYKKFQEKQTGLPAVCLPSTSPANAAFSLERLIEIWRTELFPAGEEQPKKDGSR